MSNANNIRPPVLHLLNTINGGSFPHFFVFFGLEFDLALHILSKYAIRGICSLIQKGISGFFELNPLKTMQLL